MTRKRYSDGTSPVNYDYDNPAVAHGKGRLTQVSNGGSVNKMTAYDALGRVTASSQTTSGQTYSFTYAYNLAGSVTSIGYPSGRTVSTNYDAANRPILAQSNGTNYVADVRYAAHGGLTQYQYGNNLYRTMSYNSRLQPNGMRDAVANSDGKIYWWMGRLGLGRRRQQRQREVDHDRSSKPGETRETRGGNRKAHFGLRPWARTNDRGTLNRSGRAVSNSRLFPHFPFLPQCQSQLKFPFPSAT